MDYAYHGIVVWPYAMTLILSQGMGAYLGGTFALKKGDTWVKWAFMIVIVVSLLKLLM